MPAHRSKGGWQLGPRKVSSPKAAKEKTLPPILPNAGIRAGYRQRLDKLIKEMNDSVIYWLGAAYKKNPPIALDESPAVTLQKAMNRLSRQWLKRFNALSKPLADKFADETLSYTDKRFASTLKEIGFTVKFTMTAGMNEAYQAVIAENVGLIKSIPQQYLAQVQGMVMRSVSAGRDLGTLTKDIQHQFGVTKRRAAFIALDQNNKATAVFTRTRRLEAGITEAIWMHSGGGKEPRPSHVKAGREKLRFDVATGAYIDGAFIQPGQLVNCRCTSRAVIPGL